MSRRLLAPATLVALAFSSACAGPPIPTPLDDLPVCADFEQGHTKMEGSLRFPVRMRVLDGKTPVSKVIISGLRRPQDPRPRTFLVDDNAEYTIEWAQCSNERAPRSVADAAHDTSKNKDKIRGENETGYDCGEATVYKTEKLVTKKGDKASHAVKFVPPPNPACWAGELKVVPPPPAVDAGAPEALDAGTAATDAGAAAIDGGAAAADGGAATDAGAAATDAGAKK
ncbi:Hypothetical protein A7982_01652 [Minicystis rosea]|nr:Hypothetical protein A7982_01652 [Minicystis rosea]